MLKKSTLRLVICALCLTLTVKFLSSKYIYMYFQHGNVLRCKKNDTDKIPLIVLGILTVDGKSDLRNTQRKTWLSSIRNVKETLPFRVVYKFWFDQPTNESIPENKMYGDIEYLNVTSRGRAVGFGEKLYVWMKYILRQHKDAMMGIRLDDDVFVCVPQVFHRLDRIKSKKLYYGLANWKGEKTKERLRFADEMFVVTGIELIERIAQRKYCNTLYHTCDKYTDLVELGLGSASLSTWLSIYEDVDFYTDNEKLFHHGRSFKGNRSTIITMDFCEKYLVHHKSTTYFMEKLHEFNNITLL